MRLSEIDVAQAPRNLTPDEIEAAARGLDKRIDVNPKIKAEIDKKAQTYVKPLMGKWQEALAAQSSLGKDIDDPSTQRLILAGVISRYAGISPDDVGVLEKKILASDLTNETAVADIFKTAVVMTLFQRIARSTGSRKAAPSEPSAEVSQEIPDDALVSIQINSQPSAFFYYNGEWHWQSSGNPLNPTRDAYFIDQLNTKAARLHRMGKLKFRT
jgi:hypothetical protein